MQIYSFWARSLKFCMQAWFVDIFQFILKIWGSVDLHPTQIFFYFGWSTWFPENERSNSNFDWRNGFLGVDYICLDTSHDQIENFWKIVRGSAPPRGVRPPIFEYEMKDIHKGGLHAEFQSSSSKTLDMHPNPNFLLFWPVNSISGQTEGQNGISIAEMDSLGSITYI